MPEQGPAQKPYASDNRKPLNCMAQEFSTSGAHKQMFLGGVGSLARCDKSTMSLARFQRTVQIESGLVVVQNSSIYGLHISRTRALRHAQRLHRGRHWIGEEHGVNPLHYVTGDLEKVPLVFKRD